MPSLNITLPDVMNITAFQHFWDVSTFGLFSVVLPLLAVASIYLATRSIGLTLVSLIVISVIYQNTAFFVLTVSIGLAYMIYKAIWRGEH